MSFSEAERSACERLARLALEEDLGTAGDLTSLSVVPPATRGQAVFASRSPGRLAGLPAARLVFGLVDPEVTFDEEVTDGSAVDRGTRLAVVRGPMRSILTAERTALNFLQRLSGVASLTARYAEQVSGHRAKLLDTRKTTPGWRLLEKYAVRMGGGHNHRMGLCDGVLIKDNHLAALGPGPDAVRRAVGEARRLYGHGVPIEVEVDTMEQLDAALRSGPDIVLLDNMTLDQLRESVRRRDAADPRVLLEASGGVNLTTARAIAATGVDRISVGALTHSATALDIGLDYLS
ncbi:MAG: carboxylating nicotinate-nucleotide diphosphorylase [Gemmataceae bacterium]